MQTVDLHARSDMRGIDAKLAKLGSMSAMVSPMEKSIQQLVKVQHAKVLSFNLHLKAEAVVSYF